jgi:hypothetical protein
MNDDMPWVNLTQEEVEELRKQKHELTEYGKEKLRKLIHEQEMKLIDRYNEYYNDTCASMPHGMPVSMEHMQAITIRAALYAFARKYNMTDKIYVEDLQLLADVIEAQGNKFLQRTETVMKVAQERHGKDLDIL